MITNYSEKVKQNYQGSSFVSPALGWAGQGRLKNIMPVPRKNFRAKPKQAGKKEGGLGGGIFARLSSREVGLGWEGVSAIPASTRRQNRKNFLSLIEKMFARGQSKNVKKIFLFCLPLGKRKRWAGLSPTRRQLKIAIRILFKISSDFVQKVPPFFRIRILGDCCLALASLGLGRNEDFIRIFEIQKQFLPQQVEVRFAEGKHKFEKFINQSFFSFAFGERQSDNLILTAQ